MLPCALGLKQKKREKIPETVKVKFAWNIFFQWKSVDRTRLFSLGERQKNLDQTRRLLIRYFLESSCYIYCCSSHRLASMVRGRTRRGKRRRRRKWKKRQQKQKQQQQKETKKNNIEWILDAQSNQKDSSTAATRIREKQWTSLSFRSSTSFPLQLSKQISFSRLCCHLITKLTSSFSFVSSFPIWTWEDFFFFSSDLLSLPNKEQNEIKVEKENWRSNDEDFRREKDWLETKLMKMIKQKDRQTDRQSDASNKNQ